MQAILQLFDDVPSLQLLCVGKEVAHAAKPLQEGLDKSEGEVAAHEIAADLTLDAVLPNRKYEACVLYNIDHKDPNFVSLLLHIYNSLETTATVVIINEGEDDLLYELVPLLEEGRLQNANSIELLDNHNVVVAKKLQMWV